MKTPMTEAEIIAWREDGQYLPSIMRDFHNQKDIFKTIHHAYDLSKNGYVKDINWVSGQCYVIDIFLWWMAQHGYTLQKVRRPGKFRDVAEDVNVVRKEKQNAFTAMLEERHK